MANVHDLLGRDDFAQNLAKTHQKFDALKNGDGGGTSNDMEIRLAKIESDVEWIKRWLGALSIMLLGVVGAGAGITWAVYDRLATIQGSLGTIGATVAAIAAKVGVGQ